MLASRGLLDKHIPEELTSMLTYIKFIGIDIELEKEALQIGYSAAVASGDGKMLNEIHAGLNKLLYPEEKSEFQTLSKKVEDMVKDGEVMRVKADQSAQIDPRIIKNSYKAIGG